MSDIYSAVFEEVTISAVQDLFQLLAHADATVVVHEIHIGQRTEEGDTQAELLSYKIVHGVGAVTTGSGGGTDPTPTKANGAQGALTVVEINNTTIMTVGSGALRVYHADSFHLASGLKYVPTPLLRPVISPGNRLTLELTEAPSDPMTANGVIYLEEIGST